MQDIETEDILSHFTEAHQFIDSAIASGGAVLVHCAGLYFVLYWSPSAGVSRSGAVVLSYVMKAKQMSLKHAEEIVLKARPVVSPNDGFYKQLLQFETVIGI